MGRFIDFFKDDKGRLSMNRLIAFITMIDASILIIAGAVGFFYELAAPTIISSGIVLVGAAMGAKGWGKYQEKKKDENDGGE